MLGLLCATTCLASLPLAYDIAAGQPANGHETIAASPIIHPSEAALTGLLEQYKKIAAEGGWPRIAAGNSIKPPEPPKAPKPNADGSEAPPVVPTETRDPRIPQVRALLRQLGDFSDPDPKAEDAELYDAALQQAVKRFQQRHGLEEDAAIGGQTLAAMNTSVETRIRQIEATLKRFAQAPFASERYVVVNIPEYFLRVYQDAKQVESMKVVVGKPKNPTPRLDTVISYVSFNPTWGVPPRIAAEEMLPKILEYPEFLSDHNYKVYELTPDGRFEVDAASIDWHSLSKSHFPYLLVQDAGDDNALGKIKFGLKNSDGIYMHDTSAKKFFGKDARALSHGCVRVEKPRELAHFVFAPMSKFTPEKVDALYNSDEQKIMPVTNLPVHFVYWTAWVDEQTGRPQFRKDIYNLDR